MTETVEDFISVDEVEEILDIRLEDIPSPDFREIQDDEADRG